jgi:hypothetical protein
VSQAARCRAGNPVDQSQLRDLKAVLFMTGRFEQTVIQLVIPAKAEGLFNSEAGQPSALAHQELEAPGSLPSQE